MSSGSIPNCVTIIGCNVHHCSNPYPLRVNTFISYQVGTTYADDAWSQKLITINEFLLTYMTGISRDLKGSHLPVNIPAPWSKLTIGMVAKDKGTDGGERLEGLECEKRVGMNTGSCPKPCNHHGHQIRKAKKGYLAQHQLFEQVPALIKDVGIPDYCAITSTTQRKKELRKRDEDEATKGGGLKEDDRVEEEDPVPQRKRGQKEMERSDDEGGSSTEGKEAKGKGDDNTIKKGWEGQGPPHKKHAIMGTVWRRGEDVKIDMNSTVTTAQASLGRETSAQMIPSTPDLTSVVSTGIDMNAWLGPAGTVSPFHHVHIVTKPPHFLFSLSHFLF